jgi:hypothetical protein
VAITKSRNANHQKSKKITLKRKDHKLPSGHVSSPIEEHAVTVDRRCDDRRSRPDQRQKNEPVPVERRAFPRRAKVNRRRQIDPTTCERDYSPDEIEFMNALDEYKRTSGRMFPTCSEVLEVIRNLGYQKLPRPELVETPALPPPLPVGDPHPVIAETTTIG